MPKSAQNGAKHRKGIKMSTITMINEKSVVDVDVVLSDALELLDEGKTEDAYNKYLEAGMILAEQGNAEQLKDVLGMAVACVDDIDIHQSDVESQIKEIIDVWPEVISWEDVVDEIRGLNSECSEKNDNVDGGVDVDETLDAVIKQSEIIRNNVGGASQEHVKNVDGATQQVNVMSSEIEQVTVPQEIQKPLKSVCQIQEEYVGGLRVFDILTTLNIHLTIPQKYAIENMENSVSLETALRCDSVLREKDGFKEKLFSKIIRAFKSYVKHLRAVDELVMMNRVVELWKIWHNVFEFDGDIAQKIQKVMGHPEEYNFKAAQEKQDELKAESAKKKLQLKFDGDVN